MGDAGSLFLGFTLAFAGVRLRLPGAAAWDFLIPVLVLGLPILDTTLVTYKRLQAGRPVSLGGRDHCSHRLVALGYSRRQAVLVHFAVAVLFGSGGVAAYRLCVSAPEEGLAVALFLVAVGSLFFRSVAKVECYDVGVADHSA